VKISFKSVHNCKSWQSSIDFTTKRANIFYSKTCENIKKRRVHCRICFLRRNWRKKIRPHKTYLWGRKPKKKKSTKKKQINLLQSYTPCLDSRAVKNNAIYHCFPLDDRNRSRKPLTWCANIESSPLSTPKAY